MCQVSERPPAVFIKQRNDVLRVVLPQQCIHAVFDPSVPTVGMAVVFCNANRYIPETSEGVTVVVQDTRAEGVWDRM